MSLLRLRRVRPAPRLASDPGSSPLRRNAVPEDALRIEHGVPPHSLVIDDQGPCLPGRRIVKKSVVGLTVYHPLSGPTRITTWGKAPQSECLNRGAPVGRRGFHAGSKDGER